MVHMIRAVVDVTHFSIAETVLNFVWENAACITYNAIIS